MNSFTDMLHSIKLMHNYTATVCVYSAVRTHEFALSNHK